MSAFKNVTKSDLEVVIDGRRIPVAAGASFTVPDEWDASLADQPSFEPSTKKAAAPVTEEKN